jgi:hypothetical protein
LNSSIENSSSASGASSEDSSNRSDLVFDVWYSDNDANFEYTEDQILLPDQPVMTDGKDGSDGEYQYSDSGGSHWWTLGTNTLLLSLVSFASDEQDVIMEEDDQKDDRNDDKDLPMFWPPDEPRVDTEEGIENELDTYHRGHPILAAYLRDMWHLGYVLKKLRRLDEEISKLQQKRRENNKSALIWLQTRRLGC